MFICLSNPPLPSLSPFPVCVCVCVCVCCTHLYLFLFFLVDILVYCCLTIVKFVRCSFIDVSWTLTGISDINSWLDWQALASHCPLFSGKKSEPDSKSAAFCSGAGDQITGAAERWGADWECHACQSDGRAGEGLWELMFDIDVCCISSCHFHHVHVTINPFIPLLHIQDT